MGTLATSFLEATAETDSKLATRLSKLVDEPDFEALLGLFDYAKSGALNDAQRNLAYRVLSKMHTPSAKGVSLMLKVFAYLDVNENQTLEHEELTLAIEILELFCKADSVNDTLSVKELGMLIDALQSLDLDGNGVLDQNERTALRDGLWDPNAFLASFVAKD
tara:strand:- start:31001 stop:31489 length:489 start_codon:yes stop_codon:yes gene_type:complete